ncbi:hypothetical protein ACFWXK_29915 [Streptomyces sp. NPDC059070]|uniref:hypothetical protein n=1 Tax=unclassified Streptomyces TaxID=2593676 RepID=UPI0034E1973C
MVRKRPLLIAALAAGGLATGALVLAPTAEAVSPGSATEVYNCGFYGGGEATLTVAQNGTAATVTLTSSEITTPIGVGADTITTTLTMAKSGGGTLVFSGKRNPAMAAGSGVTVGPLSGTVSPGLTANAHPGSVKMLVFGVTVTCTSTAAQAPGPFVFS